MEGLIEIASAMLLSTTVLWVFSMFPVAIVGAMLIPASIELGREVLKLKKRIELITALLVAAISYLINLSVGFIVGTIIYYMLRRGWKVPRVQLNLHDAPTYGPSNIRRLEGEGTIASSIRLILKRDWRDERTARGMKATSLKLISLHVKSARRSLTSRWT
jgi:flagellar biosynthesis protein FlhB